MGRGLPFSEQDLSRRIVHPNGMAELHSQVAVVTGAGKGVGEAIARRLASMGAHVVLVARDQQRLHEVRQSLLESGGQASAFACDLQNDEAVAQLGAHITQSFGRCDILVNNAGVSLAGKPLHETTPEEWDRVHSTNLRGPYLTIRALAPLMIAAHSGHIINISSLAGRNPLPNGAAYSASKWGLNGLTYAVAEELRQHGIRVSVIAPGSVNTGFGHSVPGKDPNRKLRPDDIGAVVASLVTQPPQSFISEVLMRPTQKP
jgi:3-oxoacyl-[acyl-carrier protein] reductase